MGDEQTQQPMILVKKPDGTTVRVPLSSLQGVVNKEREASEMASEEGSVTTAPQHNNTATQQPIAMSIDQSIAVEHADQKLLPSEEPQTLLEESYKDDILPETKQTPEETKAIVTTPTDVVKHSTQNTVRSTSNWSVDDHASPLTEVLDTTTPHVVSAIRGEEQVSEFLKTASISIKSELRGRTIALLSSFLKGVRSRQQVLVYAVKPIEIGGLQLSDVEAQELVQQVEEYFHLKPSAPVRRPSVSPAPKEVVSKAQMRPLETVPPIPSYTDSMTTTRPRMSDIVPPPVTPISPVVDAVTPVVVPAESVGPVEEIQTFTKEDFRRLHADPAQASSTLLSQMQHVSEESPMLGLSVRRAWFLSPLYSEYLRILESSLQNGFSLENIAQGTDALTRDEITAVLSVNRACEEV